MIELEDRLARIETMLQTLVEQQTVREWYTTEQVAAILGKSDYSVREYCRLGRARAEKAKSGRGAYAAWRISHAELVRLQREGLLPARHEKGR